MRELLCLIAAVCLARLAVAAPPETPIRKFEGRDLFSLEQATDPQISPDGRTVAYVRVSYDIMEDAANTSIWLIDVATGTQTPLVSGPGNHTTPRWSPDGRRLAYVAAGERDRPQLYVRWMQGGQSANLTRLTAAPRDLAWSNDGRWIAFTMFAPDEKSKLGEAPPKPEGANWAEPLQVIADLQYRTDDEGYLKPGYTHAYVVASDGGAPRQLTFGAFNEAGPLSWSRDDRVLLVTGNRSEQWRREPVNTEIYQVALADGRLTQLTDRIGPDAAPSVAPDGKTIAYLGFDDELLSYENTQLYLMNSDGSNKRSLTSSLDRNVDQFRWASDGRSLLIRYDDHGTTKIARVARSGRIEPVASGLAGAGFDRPYTGGAFSVAANDVVAFTSGTSQRPADVSVAHNGNQTQLTHLNEALFADKRLAAVKPLQVSSSFDKRPIDAWIVTPPEFDSSRKYPLILEIHGGPFAAYGPVFSTDDQLYAAAGYVVVYANPRGSTSYGKEFANLIHHDYPDHDYDDLMSVVDAAIAEPYVDAANMFVTGGSGGGVLTAWIVGHTNRFKAAAAQKPVINWISEVLTTDGYTYMPKYWFGKLPWEDPLTYWKYSPLSVVGSVSTPTLVVVGDKDFRTPVSDAEQYYQALQLRGVETALIKVPGASHEGLAARPSQSAQRASAILAWFEKFKSSAVTQ
jgi:dipeptidyl aminopeptidase/acylaminoacyl peptidase